MKQAAVAYLTLPKNGLYCASSSAQEVLKVAPKPAPAKTKNDHQEVDECNVNIHTWIVGRTRHNVTTIQKSVWRKHSSKEERNDNTDEGQRRHKLHPQLKMSRPPRSRTTGKREGEVFLKKNLANITKNQQ
jgi:hypothetical protein